MKILSYTVLAFLICFLLKLIKTFIEQIIIALPKAQMNVRLAQGRNDSGVQT